MRLKEAATGKEAEPNSIRIESTRAVGDTVMLRPVLEALTRDGKQQIILPLPPYAHCLVADIPGVTPVSPEVIIASDERVIDVSDYLSPLPASNYFPGTQRYGHLCEWMALSFSQKMGQEIVVTPDMIQLHLSSEEIAEGKRIIDELSASNNDRPVVLITPSAASENKSLSPGKTQELISRLSQFSLPVLIGHNKNYLGVEGAKLVLPLKTFTAVVVTADAYISVDTGPFHMGMGTLQFMAANPQLRVEQNITHGQIDPQKVILVVGSSRPENLIYKGNQCVGSNCQCGVQPCGAHGYGGIPIYEAHFNKPFYSQDPNSSKDQSGCVYPEYTNNEVHSSACMELADPQEIANRVFEHLLQSERI